MWKLVKAEFEYQTLRVFSLTLIIPGVVAYILLLDKMVWYNIPFIASLAVISQILIDRSNEGRRRILAILPVSVKVAGLVRLLIALIPVVVIYAVSVLTIYLFVPQDLFVGNSGHDFLMFFGLTLLAISIFFIYEDILMPLLHNKNKAGMAAISMIFIFALIIFCLPMVLFLLKQGHDFNLLIPIAIITSLGAVLLYPTVITFTKRKSYFR